MISILRIFNVQLTVISGLLLLISTVASTVVLARDLTPIISKITGSDQEILAIEPPAKIKPNIDNDFESDKKNQIETVTSNKTDNIKFYLKHINIEGANDNDQESLAKIYQPYLQQVSNIKTLNEIIAKITIYYRNKGYVANQAILEQQTIKNNIVNIKIVNGKVQNVLFEDENFYPSRFVFNIIEELKSNYPFNIKELEKQMLKLNHLGGYSFTSVINPTANIFDKQYHNIDLILKQKKDSNHLTLGINNSGSKYTKKNNLNLQLQTSNLFIVHDKITLTSINSLYLQQMHNVSLNYEIPISSEGTKIKVNKQYVDINPPKQKTYFNIKSNVRQASIGLACKKFNARLNNYEIEGNFLFKNEILRLNNLNVYSDNYGIATANYSFDFTDKSNAFNTIRLHASKQMARDSGTNYDRRWDFGFSKINFEFGYIKRYSDDIIIFSEVLGQYSPSLLPLSEKSYYGGQSFGRGYDTSALSGNSSIMALIEIRKQKQFKFLAMPAEVFASLDLAFLEDKNRAYTSNFKASSASIGLRYKTKQNLKYEMFVAKPMLKGESKNKFNFFYNLSYHY